MRIMGSYATRSNGGSASANKYQYYTEGTAGNYQKQADEVINGVKSVLSDFGMESEFKGVYFDEKDTGRINAGMNGFGELTISKSYLSNGEKNSNGYFVSDTFAGTGTHEAGHLVSYALLKQKVMPNASLLEQSTARQKNKLEKSVLKEAKKRFGSNPPISKYGSTNASEKIAEAISDVYTNKSKANPYSKEIVSVMKDINSGKFIPKIR